MTLPNGFAVKHHQRPLTAGWTHPSTSTALYGHQLSSTSSSLTFIPLSIGLSGNHRRLYQHARSLHSETCVKILDDQGQTLLFFKDLGSVCGKWPYSNQRWWRNVTVRFSVVNSTFSWSLISILEIVDLFSIGCSVRLRWKPTGQTDEFCRFLLSSKPNAFALFSFAQFSSVDSVYMSRYWLFSPLLTNRLLGFSGLFCYLPNQLTISCLQFSTNNQLLVRPVSILYVAIIRPNRIILLSSLFPYQFVVLFGNERSHGLFHYYEKQFKISYAIEMMM